MLVTAEQQREFDARYAGFSSFDDWAALSVGHARWNELAHRLATMRVETEEACWRQAVECLAKANELDMRLLPPAALSAAKLNETQPSWVQAAILEGKTGVRAIYEAEARVRAIVWELADSRESIAEPTIRRLHREACDGQDGFVVTKGDRSAELLTLPKGEYKSKPNMGFGTDGQVVPFAPVDRTQAEMDRLIDEMRAARFNSAHPVLQAAYALMALLSIHPFADANGRVARAVASIYLCRGTGLSLIMSVQDRPEYLRCIGSAQSHTFQPLVDFVQGRTVDAMTILLKESLAELDDL